MFVLCLPACHRNNCLDTTRSFPFLPRELSLGGLGGVLTDDTPVIAVLRFGFCVGRPSPDWGVGVFTFECLSAVTILATL